MTTPGARPAAGMPFIWDVGQQNYFKEKGLTNEPQRCKGCREWKRQQAEGGGGLGSSRALVGWERDPQIPWFHWGRSPLGGFRNWAGIDLLPPKMDHDPL